MTANISNRLFVGVFPGGFSYADRLVQKHGDYKRLAFLPFDTLALAIERDCPASLRAEIEESAAILQARGGDQFQVSTAGQTVTLGRRQKPALKEPYVADIAIDEQLARNAFGCLPTACGDVRREVIQLDTGRVYGPFDHVELAAWLQG